MKLSSGLILIAGVFAATDWDVRIKGGDEADAHINSYGGESAFGRLEVFLDSTWGTVCDLGFNKQVANVVNLQTEYSMII